MPSGIITEALNSYDNTWYPGFLTKCEPKEFRQTLTAHWQSLPTIGLIMIDFKRNKTSGKIFGYKGEDFGETVNTPVGAVLKIQNEPIYNK